MRWNPRTSLLLGIALLGACTKDFSRFQFRDLPPVVKVETGGSAGNATQAGSGATLGRNQIGGASSKPTGGSGGSQATGGRSGNARMDGGTSLASGGRAAAQAGSAAGRVASGGDEDAGTQLDAQMPFDASQPPPDAGPSLEQQCVSSAGRELAEIASGCTNCACGACAASVLPCLEKGESIYDRPCRELLKCAVNHGCHDWDCYCSDETCRMNPEEEGNGPCVEEMNAAAGESLDRAAVNAAHSAKDPSNPMTMALKATVCMLGSEHGSATGTCKTACEIR
jgi:hypothetical protein